MKFERLNC